MNTLNVTDREIEAQRYREERKAEYDNEMRGRIIARIVLLSVIVWTISGLIILNVLK